MRVAVVVPARLSSTRLPNKALLPYAGLPFPDLLTRRLHPSVYKPRLVFAVSDEPESDPLFYHCIHQGYDCLRGPHENPLERVCKAAEMVDAGLVVRATCDNPMLDARAVDAGVVAFLNSDQPAVCNLHGDVTDPVGYFVDVASTDALRRVSRDELTEPERMHVTLRLKQIGQCEPFGVLNENASDLSWTVDTMDQYRHMSRLFAELGPDVSAKEAIRWEREQSQGAA